MDLFLTPPPLCFIWFYFHSWFGRAKGTINFKLFEVLTKRIWSWIGWLLFFSLSHWHGLNWCEASGLPLLNLCRAWRISLLESALEAWSIESVMTTLMVNFCTLWVSVIRAFNVEVCAHVRIPVLEWWQMIMTHASFTGVLSLFLWLHGLFLESQRAITGKEWILHVWIRVREFRGILNVVLRKKTVCFSFFSLPQNTVLVVFCYYQSSLRSFVASLATEIRKVRWLCSCVHFLVEK